MFICNCKVNAKLITKILFVIICLIVTIYFLISVWNIYNNSFKVKDEIKDENIINITSKNYTNILKCVHENIDDYVGEKICFSGYIYKMYDFEDNQFVLARDMIISSDNQTVVVGFLCECNNLNYFTNNTWVEIVGEITKGNYHGDIPVIQIKKIKKIEKPNQDINVYPPDNTYIPTINNL